MSLFECRGLLSQNSNSNNDFAKICVKRAELYMKKGLYNSAQGDLDSANNVRPTAENYKNKAKCNEKLDQINDAMNNYKKALAKAEEERTIENKREKNAQIAGILLERGKLFVSQRNPNEAIEDFNKAIALAGSGEGRSDFLSLADLYLERGKCFRELTQYQESINDLKEAINKLNRPNVPKKVQGQAFNEFGFSYYENGMFELVDHVDSIGDGTVQQSHRYRPWEPSLLQ